MNQYRLGIKAGVKLDLIQRYQIDWIRDCYIESAAALEQRQGVVLGDQAGGHQLAREKFPVERINIQQGYPELLGRHFRQLMAVNKLFIDQQLYKRYFFTRGLGLRFLSDFLIQQAVCDQSTGQAT